MKAHINLVVENTLGGQIPIGVAIRLGDKIRFKIELTNDGKNYTVYIVVSQGVPQWAQTSVCIQLTSD